MIGLMWYPYIRRISVGKYSFFLSLTAGLLVFLGIDALVESNAIVAENIAGAFNGQVLIAMITIITFLVLLSKTTATTISKTFRYSNDDCNRNWIA